VTVFDPPGPFDHPGAYDSTQSSVTATATITVNIGVRAAAQVATSPEAFSVATQLVADQQWWLVAREQRRSTDALWRIGEAVMIVIMWSTADRDAGYVGACPICVGPALAASVYQQSSNHSCSNCLGTGLSGPHGGVKAVLVRPSVWTWDEEQTQWLAKGEVDVQAATVTTTGDVWANRRDYVIRGDGNRYIVNGVSATHLSTGYGTPSHVADQISVSLTVVREMPSSPIYALSPSATGIVGGLDNPYQRAPGDFAGWEFVDGPLEQR
jgi:hypothetical protein